MKYKTPLIIALVLLGSVGFVPSAHAVTSGCYSQGSDEIVQPVNGACPSGTSAVGTNGAPATVANGNLSYTPLEPLSPAETSNINFCQLLNFAFQVLIYLGGMFAVLALVIGGITYMVSGVANKISKAKTRIRAAIYGLLLLISSWLILNTVNPQLISACNILAPANSTAVINQPISGVTVQNGTIVAPDGNSAIYAASPMDSASVKASISDVQQDQNACTSGSLTGGKPGVLAPGDGGAGGCMTNTNQHGVPTNGVLKVYSNCLNVPTTQPGTFQGCYY